MFRLISNIRYGHRTNSNKVKYLFRKSPYEWSPADKRQMLHTDNGLMVRRIRDIIRHLIRVLTQVNLS